MSHRIVNNVGYKKIYPMSLYEDDSFCHYCGRSPDILNQLEWDHVPALNVKIPEDYTDIKKTLIRACKECNGLASDVPHLDYLERHFWLKTAYLRRYKRLIMNEGAVEEEASLDDPYLNATINNAKLRYQQLLDGIGFGIKDISQIDSPILEVRTKKGRKISNLLVGHLRGFPSEQDEQDEEELKTKKNETIVDSAHETSGYCSYDDFVRFIAAENELNEVIGGHEDYNEWVSSHPSRFEMLELPKSPEKVYMTTWFFILSAAKKIINEGRTLDNFDWPEAPCSLNDFISCLVYESSLALISTELDYVNWCCLNQDIATEYALPQNPCDAYETDWSSILSAIVRGKEKRKINY
ncbi:hypothetical protein [Rheinheimera baltica]|uniref:hypothetical protein n=1 Tax=Rheinheimera baltica TaxID=67576 RepID=UPI000406C18B|nr:hypothetical protein [Rheinheimera baltica]